MSNRLVPCLSSKPVRTTSRTGQDGKGSCCQFHGIVVFAAAASRLTGHDLGKADLPHRPLQELEVCLIQQLFVGNKTTAPLQLRGRWKVMRTCRSKCSL